MSYSHECATATKMDMIQNKNLRVADYSTKLNLKCGLIIPPPIFHSNFYFLVPTYHNLSLASFINFLHDISARVNNTYVCVLYELTFLATVCFELAMSLCQLQGFNWCGAQKS